MSGSGNKYKKFSRAEEVAKDADKRSSSPRPQPKPEKIAERRYIGAGRWVDVYIPVARPAVIVTSSPALQPFNGHPDDEAAYRLAEQLRGQKKKMTPEEWRKMMAEKRARRMEERNGTAAPGISSGVDTLKFWGIRAKEGGELGDSAAYNLPECYVIQKDNQITYVIREAMGTENAKHRLSDVVEDGACVLVQVDNKFYRTAKETGKHYDNGREISRMRQQENKFRLAQDGEAQRKRSWGLLR